MQTKASSSSPVLGNAEKSLAIGLDRPASPHALSTALCDREHTAYYHAILQRAAKLTKRVGSIEGTLDFQMGLSSCERIMWNILDDAQILGDRVSNIHVCGQKAWLKSLVLCQLWHHGPGVSGPGALILVLEEQLLRSKTRSSTQ